MASTDAEGTVLFNISYSDLAGNAGTAVTSATGSVTFDKTAPLTPTGLAAASKDTEIDLSWNANTESDLSRYRIYAGTSPAPASLLTEIAAGTTSYTHTSLTNGTVYYYNIRAVDHAGNESSVSTDVSSVPKANQTITFNTIATKTYGDLAFTLGNANSSAGLTVTYTAADPSVVAISGNTATILKAGSTQITASQPGSGSYNAAPDVVQTLTVNQKGLVIVNTDRSKTYGETLTDGDFAGSITGVVSGDNITVARNSTGATATAVVGTTYPIVATISDPGNKLANYTVTNTNGVLTINKASLVIVNTDRSKVYGDVLTDADFAGSLSGVVAGDDITITRSSTGADVQANANATYPIVASINDPDNRVANYTVTNLDGTLTVNRKNLTVTNTDRSKTYGEELTNGDFAGTVTGIVSGDNITITRNSIGAAPTAAAGNTYPIVATINDPGSRIANYNVSNANATLTVDRKLLTITADNKTKFQGLPLPAFSASYSGFVNGETSAVLTTQPSFSTTADPMSPQGTYPIVVSGATAANYTITHVNGVLTVTPGFPTSITLAAATVFENAAAGTLAGTLSSTSDDPSTSFKYELVAGAGDTDNGLFEIASGSNQIRTKAPLNFENKANYKVRVRSIAQNSMLHLDREFTIAINNVNEAPTIDALANSTICYTSAQQIVPLSNITPGPDANETTAVSVSSSNNSLFEVLSVTQATANGTAQLRYKLAANASGTAVITVLVQDNGGIANGGVDFKAVSFTLSVNPLPVIAITSNKGTSLSKGEVAVLKADVSVANNGLTYSWSNANGILSGQNTQNLTVRPSETTTYTVTVTNANGCVSTQSITIEVLADYKVVNGTNILTPNGDGVNDNFVIRNIDMYPNNVVKIFDRAGRLMYSKSSYGNDWGGTFNGSPLAEDTYYYIVDFGPGAEKIKGFITIVRD
nr:MBG domain-containing protein [Pedobacter sp. SYSU D00535]